MSSIVTLTTDWSTNDYYTGIVKALIISKCKDVSIIDISHNIQPYSIPQAAFIVKSVYKNFPLGTIHIIGVNSINSKNNSVLVVVIENQYFITSNNGFIDLLLSENQEIQEIYEFKIAKNISFPEKDIFTEIACKIINNENISDFSVDKNKINLISNLLPIINEKSISGNIIYIDSYGNIITNITKNLFQENIAYAYYAYCIIINNSPLIKITTISDNYDSVKKGELVAIFNSLGLLEIAQRNGNFAQMFAIDYSSPILIIFGDSLCY